MRQSLAERWYVDDGRDGTTAHKIPTFPLPTSVKVDEGFYWNYSFLLHSRVKSPRH